MNSCPDVFNCFSIVAEKPFQDTFQWLAVVTSVFKFRLTPFIHGNIMLNEYCICNRSKNTKIQGKNSLEERPPFLNFLINAFITNSLILVYYCNTSTNLQKHFLHNTKLLKKWSQCLEQSLAFGVLLTYPTIVLTVFQKDFFL